MKKITSQKLLRYLSVARLLLHRRTKKPTKRPPSADKNLRCQPYGEVVII
jgi:hypothetical protein